MLQYMLDTDICVYIMAGRSTSLKDRFDRLADDICISSITLGELRYGVENSTHRTRNAGVLSDFVHRLDVLSFSPLAADHYGEIRAGLKRSGSPVGYHDMLIGAHARSEGLTLVTNNRREFDRMPGLMVENWV